MDQISQGPGENRQEMMFGNEDKMTDLDYLFVAIYNPQPRPVARNTSDR